MGKLTSLKSINERIEQDAPRESVPYLKLKDGETVRVRFLQELDADSPGYNEKAGLGFLAVEHQVDGDFKNRFLCSYDDEGRCLGCERHDSDYKSGNRQKIKLYVNVLVERQGADPVVQVLSQGNGDKSITGTLLEYAGENGTITDRVFKIKRKGAGQTDTGYTLISTDPDPVRYDPTQHELIDLDAAVREVTYDEQAKLYGRSKPQESSDDADAPSGGSEEIW